MSLFLGKRSHPDESLVVIELFSFTAPLVQSYKIRAGFFYKLDYKELLGITNQPRSQVHVIFAPRKGKNFSTSNLDFSYLVAENN